MKECSVIIPVYNTKKYIDECLKSIQQQSNRNIEIIAVDDGSIDESASMIDKCAFSDQRMLAVHQINEGVSQARNVGIQLGSGEYIGFVDADDTISLEMYQQLYSTAAETKSDIVMCDATTVYLNGRTEADTITQLSENHILKKSDFTPSLLLEMAGSACRCIYSKHIYSDKLPNDYGVRFPLGVKLSEDRIFNLYAFGKANQVTYMKESYYNRLVHDESCVMSFHSDYFECIKKANTETQRAILEAWDNEPHLKRTYSSQFISGAICSIYNYYYKTSTMSLKERRQAIQKICNDAELRDAIIQGKYNGWKMRLILKKRISLLEIMARLANWKHGR